MSEEHEQNECNTTATLVTRVQHERDTNATRPTRVQNECHECDTDEKC